MARSVLEIIIQMVKKGGGDREIVKGLSDVKRAWTTGLAVMGSVAAAYAVVDKVMIQNANRFADYAVAMDDMSRVTGIQVEQMSRLVQAADDVRIPQETLNKGLEFAVRNGYEPSVEWLGQMADRINGMPPGAARAEEAIRLFGKASGPDMLRLLELGQGGIEEYMGAVDDGLVVTADAVQRARDYKVAVDNLNDSWEAVKMQLGEAVLPVLTRTAERLVRMEGLTGAQVQQVDRLDLAFRDGKVSIEEYTDSMERLGVEPVELGRNYTDWARGMYDAQVAAEEVADQAVDTADQMRDFGSIARQSVEEVSVAAYQLALTQDGVFDEADMQRLLDYQVALGTMTEVERAAAEQALALNDYLNGLPADIPVNIRITITRAMGYGATSQEAQWLASNPALAGLPGLAEGGLMGAANVVGERGWEAVVRREDGSYVVIPHEMSQFLADHGLLPVSGYYGGGGTFDDVKKGSSRTAVNTITKSSVLTGRGLAATGGSEWTKSDAGGSGMDSGAGNVAEASGTMAAAAAVDAVAPLVQDTMNTFTASTQQNSQQVAQQTQMMELANRETVAELRATRRAVEALAEQIAAEMQKNR